MVIWPNGQYHFVHKELLEGMTQWAKGVDVTVVEYRFDKVIQTAAPKKTVAK